MGPGEVDVKVIRRHLAALRESLQVLVARQGVSLEELDTDTELLWVVERGLQICAQNALDLHELVHERLGDFESFASGIEAYLESL